ncbi:Protein of unknown function [Gryllus bimaculatus]|nr:Protein of unknown function [Gryllus bimaculatus]
MVGAAVARVMIQRSPKEQFTLTGNLENAEKSENLINWRYPLQLKNESYQVYEENTNWLPYETISQ